MLIVPLQAVPNQTLTVQLAGQNTRVNVYQKNTGLFLDLYVGTTLILCGVLAGDREFLVMSPYLGFVGDLAFYDTIGTSNPFWTGLGARYQLAYLAPSEL
jgi:hypothetical protein